jgi:antitoxin (DNA-binding transcriptional repressor) of toxin-antitoxin stability system
VKRYTSSQLRSRLSEVLDAAERGESVVVERRGARFRLIADRGSAAIARPKPRRPLFEIVDPAVAAGQWTWNWSPRGLRFRSLLKKRRKS